MSKVETIIENGFIKVKSDYNITFITKVKNLSAKWEKPFWVVPEFNKDELSDLLLHTYGDCGSLRDVESVLVEINLDEYDFDTSDNKIKFSSKVLAFRESRDSDVSLGNCVSLIAGGFKSSGGSAKYPAISQPFSHTVLRFYIPLEIYEKNKNLCGVKVVNENEHIEQLKQERLRLLKRIAEIDEILEKEINK